ncbi:MAG TPA: hypothetical protein VGO47_00190 [Chlamydiales bacterium]|nr:hypothetical protein [Chlamydiales bacterium]
MFSLAVASLKNYQFLAKQWFGRSLEEFNFHILPLAFSYDFRTLTMLDLESKPEAIANIVRMVTKTHGGMESSDKFYFVCEVTSEIKSAKKFDGDADFVTVIGADVPDTAIYIKTRNPHDQYPLSYKRLVEKVKELRSDAKPRDVQNVIKKYKLKMNEKYCGFIFTSKEREDQFKKTGNAQYATSIYNTDAVRFIAENLDNNESSKI